MVFIQCIHKETGGYLADIYINDPIGNYAGHPIKEYPQHWASKQSG